MKITAIDYGRLLALGKFENERIILHADIDETDNIIDTFKDLKATVFQLHAEGMLLEESKRAAESEEPKEKPKTTQPTLKEIDSLRYLAKTSEKGYYQTTSKTNNQNNLAFQKLQEYLKEHNNFAILYGYKLWNFANSDIIGRRPVKKR